MSKRETWKEGLGDNVAHHNLRILKDDQDSVIDEYYTKTVGIGKDFNTLDEAMQWVMTLKVEAYGIVALVLDDGVHTIGDIDTYDTWFWAKYVIRVPLVIRSASNNKSACTITLPNKDDGDNGLAIFTIPRGAGSLNLSNIVIDPIVNGYPYSDGVQGFYISGGYLVLDNVDIKNCWKFITSDFSGFVRISGNTTLTGNGGSYADGLVCTRNGIIEIRSAVTISGMDQGVVADKAGKIISGSNLTFTDCTNDTNIPVNEIQYDQACISSGTAALTLKA